MFTIERFSAVNINEFKTALRIRTKVFVEEQGVPANLEHDDFEYSSTHYLIYHETKAVGTARWRRTLKGIKLERFAVIMEYRRKGAGRAILAKVLNDLIGLDEQIYLHAQEAVVNFYIKYGFVIKGEIFEEAGISHYYMEYRKT